MLNEGNSDTPTANEIRAIIQRLKHNESPGEDALPPEVFKQCSDILASWIHPVITKVWELELIASKIFISLLLRRFQAACDVRTRRGKYAFRSGSALDSQAPEVLRTANRNLLCGFCGGV